METYERLTTSEEETKALGYFLGERLKKGDVITLDGDLGVGKTTFTKGIASGLQIKRAITSPTFTIVKEYAGTLPLYHMDAYRLEHSDEDIGFDEYFFGEGISVVEWSTFIEDFLPEERLQIIIERIDDDTRKFTFKTSTKRFIEVICELKKWDGM
ncbi:MAG TPA: tRNA (adenosine(37)-N6)-threonylcarbamoyltransferase complex ATPase subunit type 1 TsaE [Pseudogracilibacillus sp.]|nr:tRNA (adenosine(37)-N6)-threonylcarbamoyltransferase complex ATPase subunit type 1 TsaE [Pseudogracilibacillus sp.]